MDINLGEQYVKNYNKNLSKIIKNAVNTFQQYYDTNKSFVKVKGIISKPLKEELDTLHEKIGNTNLFQKVFDWFPSFRENYTYDKTISVINDEIKTEIFDKEKEKVELINYSEFIDLLYRRESIRYYYNFVDKNKKLLEKAFNEKKIEKAFKFVKKNRELHTFEALKEKQKLNSITNLTQNEKLILINILFDFSNDKIKGIPPTEYYRILALCSSSIEEEDFYKAHTNNTKFMYFSSGVNATKKRFSGDKRLIIENIINKIQKLPKISKFLKSLDDYKTNKI